LPRFAQQNYQSGSARGRLKERFLFEPVIRMIVMMKDEKENERCSSFIILLSLTSGTSAVQTVWYAWTGLLSQINRHYFFSVAESFPDQPASYLSEGRNEKTPIPPSITGGFYVPYF
jgi:hypothetical protein